MLSEIMICTDYGATVSLRSNNAAKSYTCSCYAHRRSKTKSCANNAFIRQEKMETIVWDVLKDKLIKFESESNKLNMIAELNGNIETINLYLNSTHTALTTATKKRDKFGKLS